MTDHCVARISLPVLLAALTALTEPRAAAGQQQLRQDSAPPPMVGVQDVAWSHDGRAVYFTAMRVRRDFSDYKPEKWAVYRYELASGSVSLFAASSFSVAASPTALRVIVGKLVNGNRDLYLLDGNGRELGRITSDPAEDFAASFAPNGQQIAYTSKRSGRSEAYVANSDGSNVRRLVNPDADRTLNPTWSPDGQHIAYYREKGDGKDQIHIVRPDGSGDTNLTNDTFNNVFPGWTLDARVVYGQGLKGARTSAYTVDVTGRDKRPLLGIKSFFTRFSPDGSKIAYLEEDPADGVRFVIASNTGSPIVTVPLGSVGMSP